MRIRSIRERVRAGSYLVYDHAVLERFRDGITVTDMKEAIFNGKIVEDYPDRDRCLILGKARDGRSIHLVVDWSKVNEIELVTAYLPDKARWARGFSRRRTRD